MNTSVRGRETPLLIATCKRNYDIMKILINAGADVNACTWYGLTALMAAADKPHTEAEKMVNFLIDTGTDVNMTIITGSTAQMDAACKATSSNVISALVKAGADVNPRNDQGRCTFTQAPARLFDEGLEIIIEAAEKTDQTGGNLPLLSDIDFDIRSLKE